MDGSFRGRRFSTVSLHRSEADFLLPAQRRKSNIEDDTGRGAGMGLFDLQYFE